ncbi:MAG: Rieske 2Fe-2S domain-containing protein [Planctomycetaceae bacterium]
MQRRTFLIWFGRSVYTAGAAVVAGAGFRFLSVPLAATATSRKPLRRRIATLDSLPTGEPQLLPVIGTRQDAWTRHAEHVIGRIWVTRTSPVDAPPEKTELTVFNAACPHNGCPIQKAAVEGFACHCHGAKFRPDGSKVDDSDDYVNRSPRGMDLLGHRVVRDQSTGRWWVEVEYKNFEAGLAEQVERA